MVRNLFKTDFCESGHCRIYPFIPDGEIWIEQSAHESEWPFLLWHERYEYDLMGKGMSYDEAHEKASAMEWEARKAAEVTRNGKPKDAIIPDDSGKDIALAGYDGQKAETLLANSKAYGIAELEKIVGAALARYSDNPLALMKLSRLLTHDEVVQLADVFAAINSTAELLGRARVRRKQDAAEKKHTSFSEDTDFSCFDEGIHPLAPMQALDYFKKLIPRLGIDPERWGQLQERHAFTLAVATEGELLTKIKDAIIKRLETGKDIRGAKVEIKGLMDDAGVSHRNPVYSELIWRTNAMDSYNAGWSRELAEPDVAEAFPVWRYANPNDNRSRPTHAARAGKYYAAGVPFAEVRGLDVGDIVFCRCTGIPIFRDEWLALQANGATITPFHAAFSEDELVYKVTIPTAEWKLIEAGAWEPKRSKKKS
jgi:hypothetical protein